MGTLQAAFDKKKSEVDDSASPGSETTHKQGAEAGIREQLEVLRSAQGNGDDEKVKLATEALTRRCGDGVKYLKFRINIQFAFVMSLLFLGIGGASGTMHLLWSDDMQFVPTLFVVFVGISVSGLGFCFFRVKAVRAMSLRVATDCVAFATSVDKLVEHQERVSQLGRKTKTSRSSQTEPDPGASDSDCDKLGATGAAKTTVAETPNANGVTAGPVKAWSETHGGVSAAETNPSAGDVPGVKVTPPVASAETPAENSASNPQGAPAHASVPPVTAEAADASPPASPTPASAESAAPSAADTSARTEPDPAEPAPGPQAQLLPGLVSQQGHT